MKKDVEKLIKEYTPDKFDIVELGSKRKDLLIKHFQDDLDGMMMFLIFEIVTTITTVSYGCELTKEEFLEVANEFFDACKESAQDSAKTYDLTTEQKIEMIKGFKKK